MLNFIITAVGIFSGVLVSSHLINKYKIFDVDKKRQDATEILEQSKNEAEAIKKEGEMRLEQLKKHLEEDHELREARLKKIKDSLSHKGESLSKKENRAQEVKLKLASYKEEIQSAQDQLKRIEQSVFEKLSAKSGMTVQEVKDSILYRYDSELKNENEKKLLIYEEELKDTATKKAQKIVINTMQRLNVTTSVENKAVLIKVPKDQIKGKIVGKNGSNIKYFEELIDVAVVFNDLPNVISLSAFNLVSKRIAEVAIKKLIKFKGVIDHNVIKKAVNDAERETDQELYEIGEKALKSMGINKLDNKEFVRTIGRLQYRTSYGQNIMKHSMEVGWIAQMIGGEIGLDLEVCKVGGFLHDLGKAIDQDPNIQESHDKLSKELMEKYGFSPEEVHAAWTHHDAIPQETAEALIVKAADAVSGGRPGARQDTLERYIEKMKALDETVNSFEGIKKSFAMSAGREIRVYVDPEQVLDDQITGMAYNIARKIENNVVYPGKIKVKVVRRTKATEVAK